MTGRELLAASVALTVGCGMLLDRPVANRCEADADCAVGSCDVEREMCVSAPRETMRVAVEVVPATGQNGGPSLPVSFGPFDVSGAVERNFELPLGVSVRGQVRHIGEPVSASITFKLISDVPGGPPTPVATQTFSEPVRDGMEVFDYGVQLLPDRIYEVTVQPQGEWRARLPPLRHRFQSPAENTRTVQPFTWGESLPRIQGVLVDGTGAGQAGMLVRALETSGRAVSSTYTTGNDPERPTGWFEIVLTPGAESWIFSINASSSRIEAGRPSPAFAVDPNALLEGPEGVTILVPSLATQVVTYGGFVEVAGSGGQGTPATLTFTARDVLDQSTHVLGSFTAMATTSEEEPERGAFMVQLLPGTYDVVVTPTDPALSVLRETVRLDAASGLEVLGQTFQVRNRARYGGRVQTFGAESMPNALVRGRARGTTHGGRLPDVAVYARSSEELTDPNGQFNVPLDVGLYDVIVEPPSGTNWPWAIQRDVAIGGSESPLTNVVELSAPVPLSGRAVHADGTFVAGGELRAYAIVSEAEGSTRAVQIGRTHIDAEGNFTLLLPSSL